MNMQVQIQNICSRKDLSKFVEKMRHSLLVGQ